MSETLEFGSGLAEPGLSNKVTFLLYFTPKWSSWAQSDPILHHLKQSMGAGIVFSSWGEVQTCLQTGNLKNFGLKRIFRPKPLCTECSFDGLYTLGPLHFHYKFRTIVRK